MSEKMGSETNQTKSEKESNKRISEDGSRNGIKLNDQNSQTPGQINEANQIGKKWVAWLKRPFTDWIVAFATLAIAIMTVFQWQILKRTDETSRLRDRAFLYFSNPTFIPYPTNEPIVWGIVINGKNEGDMPARRISIRYSWITSQNSENIVDPFPLAKWSSAQVPNVIGPKQSFSLQGGEIPISIIKAAKKSKINVFILMEVQYIDGFELDKDRLTQMSRSLRFDLYGGQSLGFAGPHNCTDDDCNLNSNHQ